MIKKICAIIIATIISCVPLLFAFGSSYSEVIIHTNLSEPQIYNYNSFWIANSSSNVNEARLYQIVINSYYMNTAENYNDISVGMAVNNGNWTFQLSNNSANYVSYYVLRYRFNGELLNVTSGTINPNSVAYYPSVRSLNDYNYYWCSSNVVYQITSGYSMNLMEIDWNTNYSEFNDIHTDLDAIQALLVYNNNYSLLTVQELDQIWQQIGVILNNWDWFKNTYYNYITDEWTITNSILTHIYEQLGGYETAPTYENDTELESDVNEYHDSESRLFEEYDRYDGVAETLFSDASQQLGSFSNSFLFIRNIFDTFIPQGSLPYLIIFFSLSFGLVVLIIGKKVTG